MTVAHLPSAVMEPVRQTRVRGRLPRSVGSLKEAKRTRMARLDAEHRARFSDLAADAGATIWARGHMADRERRIVFDALAILGRDLQDRDVFTDPAVIKQYLSLQLGALPHEEFGVMFLDSQYRMIAFERMFRGTLTQTSVYPREVVLRALANNAAAVVMSHNHPSGSLQPSRADVGMTATLNTVLALVDVRILDHVIVGGAGALSMAEMGML